MPPLDPEESLEDLVLERFEFLNKQIEGVKRVFKTPPDKPVGKDDYPYVYGLIGDIIEPTSSGTGNVTISRQFGHRLMVMPITKGLNDAQEGAEANTRALPFFSRWMFFYTARPQLQHDGEDGLPPLRGCELSSFNGSGLVTRPGPNNIMHAAIDFLFVVKMSRRVKRVSSPYFGS